MPKLGQGLIRELCPVCTEETESSILLNAKLSKGDPESVKKVNGGVKWSKEFCPKCAKMKADGLFILIGAVEAKTVDATAPYRSGNVWGVKQEVAVQLFAPHEPPKSGVAFIDVTVAEQMKLPKVNLNA
jgi:hypothetical protein